MSYLIDTNVVSEIRKAERCDPRVLNWYQFVDPADLFLSTLVVGEIRKGIELARRSDPEKAARFEDWLRKIQTAFGARILGIDNSVSDRWGRMCAIRPIPMVDGLMASTAATHGLTLVTRNERDIAGLGVAVLNPFRTKAN